MAQEVKPTNEYIIALLERVLGELEDLARRQGQIEADLSRLADAAGS